MDQRGMSLFVEVSQERPPIVFAGTGLRHQCLAKRLMAGDEAFVSSIQPL
jgi:hypothetical protein